MVRAMYTRFDAGMYARINDDVDARVISPRLHYLKHGRYEGREFPLRRGAADV